MMKGLTANIYDCGFIDGLSPIKHVKQVTIIGEGMPELFTADKEHPAVKIVRRNIYGSEYVHAEPLEKGFYAFGGRYIASSDSRVRELNKYPIPLHDRDMSKE